MEQLNKISSPNINIEKDQLQWICLAPGGAPYFTTQDGTPWTPIGHNDAINWPELNNLF